MGTKFAPIHPGEILLEEFLKPMGLSQNSFAMSLETSARRVNEIVLGKRSITADTALRFGKYFDMEPEFWLNLQMRYELEVAKDKIGGVLKGIKTRKSAA